MFALQEIDVFRETDENQIVKKFDRDDRRKQMKRKRTEDVAGSVTSPQQSVDDSFDGPESEAQQLPDDLVVFQVLTKLPIKKLFQCMCVSKAWCSIIRQPGFSKAYRNCGPFCLIITIPDVYKKLGRRFCYSPLRAHKLPEKFIELLKVSVPIEEKGVTPVVNGLVCYYTSNHVFISNVFTGEVMEVPPPPNLRSGEYYLGYDSVNRLYKLLFITGKLKILTLGSNSSWREVVLNKFHGKYTRTWERRNIWVNEVLYWIDSDREGGQFTSALVSFNLSEEKFGNYFIPIHIDSLSHYYLVQFRGRLSILTFCQKKMTLNTLEDGIGDAANWSRHEVILPSELWDENNYGVIPVGNLPTGEILLAAILDNVTPVYSYDCEKNKFERFVVGELPLSVSLKYRYELASTISCAEQNIATLDALIRGG